MIRKSNLGKRVLACVLCAALTLTSVTPTFASEVSGTAVAVQTETSEAPAAVTEEKEAEDTKTDAADEATDAEQDKAAPDEDSQNASDESKSEEVDEPKGQDAASETKGKETEEIPVAGEDKQEEQAQTVENVDTAESKGAVEVQEADEKQSVSAIEIWDEYYNNSTAQKVEQRFGCVEAIKSGFYYSIVDDYVVVRDTDGNILRDQWNSSYGTDYAIWSSEDGSLKLTCTIKDKDGKELTSYTDIQAGTYTVEYVCGDVTASYKLICKNAADMAQALNPEGTKIPIAKNFSAVDSCFTYTPETTGEYYLDLPAYGYGSIIGFYLKDGNAVGLNTNTTFVLTEGVTYYFMFTNYSDNDYKVGLSSKHAISSVSIIPGSLEYLTRLDSMLSDWKLSVVYEDGNSRVYRVSQMNSSEIDGKYCLLDAYKNPVYYELKDDTDFSMSIYNSLSAGTYSVRFYLTDEDKENATKYTINVKNASDEASWPANRVFTTGSNSVSLAAGKQSVVYKYTAEKSSAYTLTYNAEVEYCYIYNKDFEDYPFSSNFANQKHTVTFSLTEGEVYYFRFGFWGDTVAEEDINFDARLQSVPSLKSISLSAEEQEINLVEGNSISDEILKKLQYAVVYDDETEGHGSLPGNSFNGLYDEFYVVKLVDDEGIYRDIYQSDIPVGDYKFAVYEPSTDEQLAVCEGLTLHIVSMDSMVTGKLSLGDNTITATDWDTDEKIYYTFTPETSGKYYFKGANSVNGKYREKEGYWNYVSYASEVMDLSAGVTYYFWFVGSMWDNETYESSYSYVVSLQKAKTISAIEKVSGKSQYLADWSWVESAFEDWKLKVRDTDGENHKIDLSTIRTSQIWNGQDGYDYYMFDKNAGIQMRYELYLSGSDEKLSYNTGSMTSAGEYTLTLYTDEADTTGVTFRVKCLTVSEYNWTGLDLVEGENTVDPNMTLYRFTAKENGAYNFICHNESMSAYIENDGRLEDISVNSSWDDDTDVVTCTLAAKAGESYYIRLYGNENVTVEKCPTIEKFTLITNGNTNTSLLADAEDRNTVGFLKAELTYSNGVVNTVTMEDNGYVDGENNGLVLELTDASGKVYHFADALPAGTYTVRAKLSDAEVYSDNSYTVTAKALDSLVAGKLTLGDNKVLSGFSEYKDAFSSAHLYTFTPAEAASYRFSPAAQIAVYTRGEDGSLACQNVYGSYNNASAKDVVIPLEKGTTYYLSLTGFIRNSWYEKQYSWTMHISEEKTIQSVEIAGKLPYDTFYTGGDTRSEIQASVKEAVKELNVTYTDGTTKTVAADKFKIIYPNRFYNTKTYDLDVTVWVQSTPVTVEKAVQISLLSEDQAVEWNSSSPLNVSYGGLKVKPGQAVLYKATGLKEDATYDFVSRADTLLDVDRWGSATSSDEGVYGCYTKRVWDDYTYVWVKPAAGVTSFTVTAFEHQKIAKTTVTCLRKDLYAGLDYLSRDDVQVTLTYENGETYTRACTEDDEFGMSVGDESYYGVFRDQYAVQLKEAGSYTFWFEDDYTEKRENIGSFEVKALDTSAVSALPLGKEVSLDDIFYTFTPSENGVYMFVNEKDADLHLSFTCYENSGNEWSDTSENGKYGFFTAGTTYLIRLQGPSGTWKLVQRTNSSGKDVNKPIRNVSISTENLYYDPYNDYMDGFVTVEYTDGTTFDNYLGYADPGEYLSFTTARDDEAHTFTVYVRYRSEKDGAWTDCDPVVLRTSAKEENKLTLNKEVTVSGTDLIYDFTSVESGWYQILVNGAAADSSTAAWKNADGEFICGNTVYIEKGVTCSAVVNKANAADGLKLKVQKTDMLTAVRIVSGKTLDVVFNMRSSAFEANLDDIQVEVEVGGTKKTVSGETFRTTYGGVLNVTGMSANSFHVVASVPDSNISDEMTVTEAEIRENKVYTTAEDGTMTYTGKGGIKGYTHRFLPTEKWIPADAFTFTPNRSGLYVMSCSGIKTAYGAVTEKNGARLRWYSDNNVVYLEEGKTYYQALPYDSDGEYTLTLTPIDQYQNGCQHTYTSTVTKPATCKETGIMTYTCTKCGNIKKETLDIDKNNHTHIVSVPAKAATCTAAGLTEGRKCDDCGTVIEPQKTIQALGHTYGSWTTTKAATVVAAGVQTRTCTRCNHKETRAIAKLAATGTLSATNFPLKVKQTAVLRVNNMAAGDRVVSWAAADTKIATVDGAGKVTGKKKGKTTITATLASSRKLTATVNVQTGAVKTTGISVNTRNVSLAQNKTYQLVSVIAPFTSKDKISYKTSNKKIATVSNTGKITAKKAGKATITVKAGKKSVKVTVNVIGVKTTAIRVSTTQLNLKVKKKATLKAYVTPGNSSEKVTWKSSNKKVATADAKGKVTGKKAGTATITVTSGSKSAKVTVTVTK